MSRASSVNSQPSRVLKGQRGTYFVGASVGKGAFATVRHCCNTATGQSLAVKVFCSRRLGALEQRRLREEVDVMRQLNHVSLLRFYDFVTNEHGSYLIMEFAPGGCLHTRIERAGHLGESTAWRYFRQLIYGLDHMHRCGIAHRDLKPDNLLLSARDEIKVSDFGMSLDMKRPNAQHEVCGTPCFMAPEVIEKGKAGYDTRRADIWSCGAILFVMVEGAVPFDGNSLSELLRKMRMQRRRTVRYMQPLLLDLVNWMLSYYPKDRPSLAEIMSHDWFTGAAYGAAEGQHMGRSDYSIAQTASSAVSSCDQTKRRFVLPCIFATNRRSR